MSTVDSAWLDEASRSARDDFVKELKNPHRYDFTKFGTINDVYDATDEIQKEQARTKTVRGLTRLEPLLQALKEFSGTIEVFVQAKPDILALVWGPLKLLLQLSSSLGSAFEKVVKVLGEIGDTLPLFQSYASLFQRNRELKRVLCLFYGDILDFYKILLNFVQDRRLNTFLEMLWPNIRLKIKVVQENVMHHKSLMTDQVALEHILQSFQARNQAMQEHERAQEFRDSQYFETASAIVGPYLYDNRLAEILDDSSVRSGGWLFSNTDFKNWIDPTNSLYRCLWLCGIPGSGKTFLAANIIRQISSPSNQVLFVFLTHENQALGRVIKVFHSLLFQASRGNASLKPILSKQFESNSGKILNDVEYVKKLAGDILNNCGPTSIVIDGLDELDDRPRQALLRALLDLLDVCQNTRVLISSRSERDIEKTLGSRALALRVDHHNMEDIQSYADAECKTWLADLQGCGADARMLNVVRRSVSIMSSRCQGMFLRMKLVFEDLKDQATAFDVETELENLPEGLDQAYGRILTRIDKKLSSSLRTNARKILGWIACAQRPLREEELLQILVIQPEARDFVKGRKAYLDIRAACGPIIEAVGGLVHFVHFSAKEYVVDQKSSFMKLEEANLDAAMVCSGYLSYTALDVLFQANPDTWKLKQLIVNGDSVFFDYAANMWLQHIVDIGTNGSIEIGSLSRILSRVFDSRAAASVTETETSESMLDSFEMFEEKPRIQELLASTYKVHGRMQYGLLDDEDPSSKIHDPLHLFQALEACCCSKLLALYGPPTFYCDKPFCSKYRVGFALRTVRDQHLSSHRRPFKCPERDCIYFEHGFLTQNALAQHENLAHRQRQSSSAFKVEQTHLKSLPDSDLTSMLEDAISQSDLDAVNALPVAQPDLKDRLNAEKDGGEDYTLSVAAWKSTPDVLHYLLNVSTNTNTLHPHSLESHLAIAIETKNLPNIIFLLSKGAVMTEAAFIHSDLSEKTIKKARENRFGALRSSIDGLSRALSLWDPGLMEYLTEECKVTILTHVSNPAAMFRYPAIRGLAAEEVTNRFEAMRKYLIWPDAFDKGVLAAIDSHSVAALKICLENGGDANGKVCESKPVLRKTVIMGTLVGAKMARLLLKHGAEVSGGESSVGKRKIEAYYGLPWDEFVRRARSGEELTRCQRKVGH